uniref:Amiloride-sensitive sodium channel subunit alpha n=1 Tax=Panagrellus redivivus TaxID=6233 RepID=A0A7E4V8G5_PANRE
MAVKDAVPDAPKEPSVAKPKGDQVDPDYLDAIKEANEAENREKDFKSRTRWRRMKETLIEWGSLSSCHGIPHMVEAHSTIAVIIWIIILIICFCIFMYFFIDTIIQFFSFGKTVELELDVTEMLFPTITICNINPYKLSLIEQNPQLNALLTVYEEVMSASTG